MTTTGGDFWGLGFDPLPGDPSAIKDLELDARVFGQRMTEQADILRKFARRDGWQGEAADVFAQQLDTLPGDLRKCGNAFHDVSIAIGNYYDAFVREKSKARDLEERAVDARQRLQVAQLAFDAPVITAPGDCPPPKDRGPVDQVEDELGAILREAHSFAERFNDGPEIQNLARAIRDCAEFAPDEPRWNVLKRWAGDVFKVTPIGAALNAAHELVNHYAEFFSDLADFLSDISGGLGLLSLPLLLVPPVGTALAAGALAAAVGCATVKTSLFVGKTRDASGNLYVSGGELVGAYVDAAGGAAGMGAAAKATQAVAATKGLPQTFGRAFADQFKPAVFKDAFTASKQAVALGREVGTVGAVKSIAGEFALDVAAMGAKGQVWTAGGVVIATAAPTLTLEGNWAGVKWAAAIPKDFLKLATDQPNAPDLTLRVPSEISPADTEAPPTVITNPNPPPKPVVGDRL